MLGLNAAWMLGAMLIPDAPVVAIPAAPLPVQAAIPSDRAPVPEAPPQEPAPPADTPLIAPAPAAPMDMPPVQDVPVPSEAGIHQPDVVVTGRERWEAPDPLGAVNEKAFSATQAVDRSVVGPVSLAYKKKVPGPVRRGIHNFLYNLREPVVFVNFVFQHKIGKAAETAGRFILNSTIGVIGLFDMAKRKPFRLPRRSNGFANTLGFYGVPNGPFLFLPLVGPTTVRDLFGGTIDRLVLPVTLGQGVTDPKFAIPAGVLGALDHRAEFDATLTTLHDGTADPYVRSRDFYLQRRQAEIDRLKGRGTDSSGGNSSGMSEAPSAPIRVRPRSDAPTATPVPLSESGPVPVPVHAPVPAG